MTVDEFRSNPVLVGALRELVKGDGITPTVLARAIVAVQNERPVENTKDTDPEIVSIRRLSKIEQHDQVISLLLSCAEPLSPPTEEEPALFGVNPTEFQPKQ